MVLPGVLRQPSSGSNSVLTGAGEYPRARRPTSATPRAMPALTSRARRTLRAFIAAGQDTIWVTESPSWRRWKVVSAIFFLALASTMKLFMNR